MQVLLPQVLLVVAMAAAVATVVAVAMAEAAMVVVAVAMAVAAATEAVVGMGVATAGVAVAATAAAAVVVTVAAVEVVVMAVGTAVTPTIKILSPKVKVSKKKQIIFLEVKIPVSTSRPMKTFLSRFLVVKPLILSLLSKILSLVLPCYPTCVDASIPGLPLSSVTLFPLAWAVVT
jgi:hypothetical protein